MSEVPCPRCGEDIMTDRVYTEVSHDIVELVYVCMECDTEYAATFGDPIVEVTG